MYSLITLYIGKTIEVCSIFEHAIALAAYNTRSPIPPIFISKHWVHIQYDTQNTHLPSLMAHLEIFLIF